MSVQTACLSYAGSHLIWLYGISVDYNINYHRNNNDNIIVIIIIKFPRFSTCSLTIPKAHKSVGGTQLMVEAD